MGETKLNGESKDIVADNIQQLKQLYPEVFSEEGIDFDKLKAVLGEYLDGDDERYNFTWWGKSKALRLAQSPSTGTLRPCPEERFARDGCTQSQLKYSYPQPSQLETGRLETETHDERFDNRLSHESWNTRSTTNTQTRCPR